ncbi:hypothetical protein J2X14_002079 [Pantoea alhagi]|nr:hypothetical protein [Pantoea alhagi]
MKKIINVIMLSSAFVMLTPVAHAHTIICWGKTCVDISDAGTHP